MYPVPDAADLAGLAPAQTTAAARGLGDRLRWFLGADPPADPLADAVARLDEDPTQLADVVAVAASVDRRLGAQAGLCVARARAAPDDPPPPGADAYAAAKLDRDELLALGLRFVDRLLTLAQARGPREVLAARLMVRDPAEFFELAPTTLVALSGKTSDPVDALLLEAAFHVAALAAADPADLGPQIAALGADVRRIAVDLDGADPLAEVFLENAAFWRRPTLWLPPRIVPDAPAPIPPSPTWGTTFPLYEQAVEHLVRIAFASLAGGLPPAVVLAELRGGVHAVGRQIHDPLHDEVERQPSTGQRLGPLGPSTIRADATAMFDRWAEKLARAVGLDALPAPGRRGSQVAEALATWDPGDRTGADAAEHLAAHFLHFGLPAQRNAMLIRTLGIETVWTREHDQDHLVVAYTGDEAELRAHVGGLRASVLDGASVHFPAAFPLPDDLGCQFGPLVTLGVRWVRELAGAPGMTLDEAAANVPRWLAELDVLSGIDVTLDDPLYAWSTIDELVLAIRPPGGGPPPPEHDGALAVLAIAACEALRRAAGGRLGRLGPDGWVDATTFAEVGYRPAVRTAELASNLGQKVFERYERGEEASVEHLGRQALAEPPDATHATLLPCLQPWDHPGLATCVYRPLLGRLALPGVPVVTWADDLPIQRLLRSDGDPEALEREAVANLAARAERLPLQQVAPGVLAVLQEYAASLLLLPDVLRELGDALGAGVFAVAVPTREVLLAAAPDDPALGDLIARVTEGAPVADRLTTASFLVGDGRVVRVLDAAPPGPQVTVDGDTIRVEGVRPALRGLVDAVWKAVAGRTGPFRLELRFGGPAPTDARGTAELASAIGRGQRELQAAGLAIGETTVLVDGQPIASALGALSADEVARIAMAPAAMVLLACIKRRAFAPEQLAAADAAFVSCDDPVLIEAVLTAGAPIAEGVRALTQRPQAAIDLLRSVGELLGRLPDGRRTALALLRVGIGSSQPFAVPGPTGPQMDAPEREGLGIATSLLGLGR